MVPLKVDLPLRRIPWFTLTLMLACVGAFLARRYLSHYGHGFVPVDFMYALLHPGAGSAAASLLSLAVSFFLHAGWVHLLSNLWYLWLFGAALECSAGTGAFAVVYVTTGMASMVIQAVSSPYSHIPVVGASGAIAGVMGAFLILLPLARILMWIPLVFFVRVPALAFLLLWFVLQYVSMRYLPQEGGGVAWWAHMGGFTCGALIALWLRFGPVGRGGRRPRRRRAGGNGR